MRRSGQNRPLSAMGRDRVVGERAKVKWPNPLAREGTASLSGLYFWLHLA
jgi:hypothetical protein